MPKQNDIHKVLVIGSGPVIIGQAAEFDYSGTQACLALKEEGVEVVLVNNNPATIMTDETTADHVYLEPLTEASVTGIIKKEKPDALLPAFAGQTGLNLAVSLSEAGILNDYDVRLLGTSLETIQKGEDRDIFKSLMTSINEPVAESVSVTSVDEAVRFSEKAGFPIIVRPAYTLGGSGGGVAENAQDLHSIVRHGLNISPVSQVLVEQSVKGWKEIEYELIRDADDTCMVVCDMENIDPCGIHTGDSIVSAPAQTLSADEHRMLRDASNKVIRELGVVGACNIQFAIHPSGNDYVIIEVNPRVSRSSALASKATGYPIAQISAKLALGYHLDELTNPGNTTLPASQEPVIDYTAVKMPRWPFDKFTKADRTLGTQMKATGEVLALADSFSAALTKAIRSLDIGTSHFPWLTGWTDETIEKQLSHATDQRLFAVFEAFRRGYDINRVHDRTGIHQYFLQKMAYLIAVEQEVAASDWYTISDDTWKEAKLLGFSDDYLASLCGKTTSDEGDSLEAPSHGPVYKQAGVNGNGKDVSSDKAFFYSSWDGTDEAAPLKGKNIVVVGAGPIRIGQGIEFDYCSVHAVKALQNLGARAIVINNNPETVSTDWNMADRLYIEPLTVEDTQNVVEKEQADGVMLQFGGQTAINLADGLRAKGIQVYGTSLASITASEDRDEFYQLLRRLDIPHIPGDTVTNGADAAATARSIGYPVLVRPSYVIGGKGMAILQNESEMDSYLSELKQDTPDARIFPLLIDRFIHGREFEVDAVCDGSDVLIPGIFQHIEPAGIHSGDSMTVFPAPHVTHRHKELMETYTKSISSELNFQGMVNIQFVLSEDEQEIYVLEVNPRASRTVPIASKVTGIPLVDLATTIQMGNPLNEQPWALGLHKEAPYYAVKSPVFSSSKLSGVDPYLGPEMQSTGEAIGMGSTVKQAMRKACGWAEGSLLQPEAGTSAYVTLDSSGELSEESVSLLSSLAVHIATDRTTAAKMEEQGLHVDEVVSVQEAQARCEQGAFAFICDTQKTFVPDDHATLRSQVLASGVACFTSIKTLQAHMGASLRTMDGPQPINDYTSTIQDWNKTKEQVV
ncbi:carbamoyl-phosphate synthase large subunit [Lentibacillus halophilus]|uniref:carbamoyl-phosphate synthase (ammonia) n=1 Tax=Lentibacillus halophilus TaxID=295065 RepID=A0ABN0ZI63_9BACI